MPTVTTFTIEGSAVHDIASFYAELNRLFMAEEDWRLGASLDALDDLLYGGIGALARADDVRIVWRDHTSSRAALGLSATAEYYREKLRHPETFNTEHFRGRLADLDAGTGPTYFDIVLDVFADHRDIELILA